MIGSVGEKVASLWKPGIAAFGTVYASEGVDVAVQTGGVVKDIAFAANDKRNDEYVGYATLPAIRGSYDFAYRFRRDSQVAWDYVDLGTSFGPDACDGRVGNSDGYNVTTAGDLSVQ